MNKRASLSTPCPAPTDGFGFRSRRLSISSATYNHLPEETAQIDFTRAFEPTLRNTKPRRRSSLMPGQAAKKAAPVTVFEEVKEDEELVIEKPTGKPTLLSKPARKMAVGGAVGGGGAEQRTSGLKEIGQGRSRMSMGGAEQMMGGVEEPKQQADRRKSYRSEDIFGPAIKKEPRRKTIFIPEDTSVFTIHPGANTTAGLDDTFNIPALAFQPPQSGESAEEKESQLSKPVRRPRMSLSAAPKRAPLHPTRGPENTDGFDVCGDNTGKENLPPMAQKVFKYRSRNTVEGQRYAARLANSRATQGTAATANRQINAPRAAVPLPTTLSRASPTTVSTTTSTAASRPATTTTTTSRPSIRQSLDGPRTQPMRVTIQRHSPISSTNSAAQKKSLRQHIDLTRLEMQASKLSLYPVLPENLAQPELYEDSWLSQQEVALTEVANEIFAAAQRSFRGTLGAKSLREGMIEIYHQPEVAMLHKRLQASLMYGALSKPKAAFNSTDPARDIGLRKKFIGLFLETYDEEALRAAAEVIVGRQIPKRESIGEENGITSSEDILDPRAGRRALTGFLETFFVSPADIDFAECRHAGDDSDHGTIRWRKSILRSVLLIWLLDQAKASELVNGCLFKKFSVKKSSPAVLTGFAGMMMPSVGDVLRSMKQFDYELAHVQDPLDEVVYGIENLAVDLRDGIMLTRLVEVLLYNRKTITSRPEDGNATVTIQLPDATQLLSEMYKPDMAVNTRLLSQHLKMPCLGRVQKHFNVQVALSALEGYDVRGANVVGDITADDIVNGHREKTLSLLWSLVSVFGLKHLVDFEYVAKDVQRANGVGADSDPLKRLSSQESEKLLQDWAAAYAAKSDVKVANLTTSFANGKAYAAIIDGFSNYIPTIDTAEAGSSPKGALEARLTALGCSTAFTKQLTSSVGNIPSRETTVSNLAFLASRLLPLARQYHAAITLQRAYRKHRAPVAASQRIALMRLARHCAQVVQTRDRAINAAITIQRAWRAVVDARITKLSDDVTVFQTRARGWAARRGAASDTRVMGGW